MFIQILKYESINIHTNSLQIQENFQSSLKTNFASTNKYLQIFNVIEIFQLVPHFQFEPGISLDKSQKLSASYTLSINKNFVCQGHKIARLT